MNLETRFRGNRLIAYWATAVLISPYFQEFFASVSAVQHFLTIALFIITVPSLIEGICVRDDFLKADDFGVRCIFKSKVGFSSYISREEVCPFKKVEKSRRSMGDLFVVSIGYALYGTGFHGALRHSGLAACGLIRRLHKSDTFVLAVDLPSGINTDTGEVADGAAHADLTVTFDSYKPLHMAEASAPLCGKIICADIGLRDEWHPES